MKKLLCLLLCLMMIFPAAFSLADDYSGTCGNGLTWKFESGTLTISGSGAMEDYNSLPRWPHTTAPWAGKQIEKVVIGNGVTSIGTHAFYSCEYLSKLTIPSSVTSIGKRAIYDCPSLTELTIPSSVKNLGESAFADNISLTSVTIQDGLPSIPSAAFGDCRSLSEVHIPVSVKSIDDIAFLNCHRLAHVWYHGTEAQWDKVTKKDGLSTNAGMLVDGGLKIHCLCTVQFDANGHGKAPKAAYVFPGKTISAPSKPTASGYAFTGWYKEPECTNKWDFGKDTVPGDMTLYAGWKAQPDSGAEENVTLSKLKSVKLKALSAKKLQVSWKKLSKKEQKKIQKIEIQYSTDKAFKTYKTKWAKKGASSAKLSGLKKNTKYWVRIRAYKKSGNIIYVSKWVTKNKKTKKK